MKKQVLIIVAHPDDETIWMGGTLIRNRKKWKTTVICLTRRSDSDRYPKFKKVCKALGVNSLIFDLDDKKLKKPLDQKEILKTISPPIKNKTFDILFAHNSNGEYGHQRHIDVHKAVKSLLKKGKLKSKKVFFFAYHKIKNKYQGYAIYNLNANKLIKLNSNELLLKKHLIKNVYGFQEGGFEEKSSAKIEAFDILK